jgi:hypothetical protein
MTEEENAALDGSAVEMPGGYFYSRGNRNMVRRSILAVPADAAKVVGFSVFDADPEDDYPVYNDTFEKEGGGFVRSGELWHPFMRYAPSFYESVGRNLAGSLNGAFSLLPNQTQQGPITPYTVDQAIPNLPYELAAMYSVKTWRVHGEVGGFSFDHTIPTGTMRSYDPDLDVDFFLGYVDPPLSRSGFGFRYSFIDGIGDPLSNGQVVIELGLAYTNLSQPIPAGVAAEINAIPSVSVPVPTLYIRAQSDDGSNTGDRIAARSDTPGLSAYGAPEEDENVTLFGSPVFMRPHLTFDDPGLALAIEPASYWSVSDKWRGEP